MTLKDPEDLLPYVVVSFGETSVFIHLFMLKSATFDWRADTSDCGVFWPLQVPHDLS